MGVRRDIGSLLPWGPSLTGPAGSWRFPVPLRPLDEHSEALAAADAERGEAAAGVAAG